MLRERLVGESLWEAVLPAELAKVDEVLDDDRFMAPFRSRLTARIGRPTIPIETYLRLMYLKHRYGLGYETLCKEVADSFTWRRFCRVALDGRVPDPSTLMKLTKRLGPGLLEEQIPVAPSAFHCIPVRNTSRIAFIASRSGTRGL